MVGTGVGRKSSHITRHGALGGVHGARGVPGSAVMGTPGSVGGGRGGGTPGTRGAVWVPGGAPLESSPFHKQFHERGDSDYKAALERAMRHAGSGTVRSAVVVSRPGKGERAAVAPFPWHPEPRAFQLTTVDGVGEGAFGGEGLSAAVVRVERGPEGSKGRDFVVDRAVDTGKQSQVGELFTAEVAGQCAAALEGRDVVVMAHGGAGTGKRRALFGGALHEASGGEATGAKESSVGLVHLCLEYVQSHLEREVAALGTGPLELGVSCVAAHDDHTLTDLLSEAGRAGGVSHDKDAPGIEHLGVAHEFEDTDFVAHLTVKRFTMETGVGGVTPASSISRELRKAGLVPRDGASKAWQTKARDEFQQSHVVCTVSFPRRLLGLESGTPGDRGGGGGGGGQYVRLTFIKLASSVPSCRMFPDFKGVIRPPCGVCAKYDKTESFRRQHGTNKLPWGPPAKHAPVLEQSRETGPFAAIHAHRVRVCSAALQVACRAVGQEHTALSIASTRFLSLLHCLIGSSAQVLVVFCVERWAGSMEETISTLRLAADLRKRVLSPQEAHRPHHGLVAEWDSPSSMRVPSTPEGGVGTPGEGDEDVANVTVDLSDEFDRGALEARILALEKENRALKRSLELHGRGGGPHEGGGEESGRRESAVLQTMSEDQLLRKADRVRDLACVRAPFRRWRAWKSLSRNRKAQAIKVWRAGTRLIALKTWQRTTSENKRQRALVARQLALMSNRLAAKAFRKWVEFAEAADAAWAVGAKVVLRMKHRLTRVSLLALRDRARENRMRRARLNAFSTILLNKVQWRAFGDWSRYVRDGPRRLHATYEAVLDGNHRVYRRRLLRQALSVLRGEDGGSVGANRAYEILTSTLHMRVWEKMRRRVLSSWRHEAALARASRITLRRLGNRAQRNKYSRLRWALKAWSVGVTLFQEEARADMAEEIGKVADDGMIRQAEARVRDEMLGQLEEAQYGTERLREEAWRSRRILDYLESMINDSVRDSYLTAAVHAASGASSGEIMQGHLDKGLKTRALSLADRDFAEFKELLARIACRAPGKPGNRTSSDPRTPGQDINSHSEVRSMVRTLKKMLGASSQGGSSVKLNEAADRAYKSPMAFMPRPMADAEPIALSQTALASKYGGSSHGKHGRLVDGSMYKGDHSNMGGYAALARSDRDRRAKRAAQQARSSQKSEVARQERAKGTTPPQLALKETRAPTGTDRVVDDEVKESEDENEAREESEAEKEGEAVFAAPSSDSDALKSSSVGEAGRLPNEPLARTGSLTLTQLKECAGIIQNWYTPLMDLERSFGEVVVPPPDALRKFFRKIDYDEEGRLTHSELLTLLGQNLGGGSDGVSQRSIEQLVDALDMDGNGFVDMDEFLTLVHSVFITQAAGDTLAAVSESFGFPDASAVQALNNLEHIEIGQVLEKGTVLRLGDMPAEQYARMDVRAVKALLACRGIPTNEDALPDSSDDPAWLPAAVRLLQGHPTLHPLS